MKLGTRKPRTAGKSHLVHNRIETYMVPTKFALSFTAGGLLYHESIVVAESFVAAGCDWSVALADIEKRNLLQSRTASTAKRKLAEVRERLKLLTRGQIRLLAIQCVVAKLVARGKVEVRSDGELLENAALASALRNTQKHGNMVLEPQIEFGAGAVRKLKDFFALFFDTPPRSNEARALGEETAAMFRQFHEDLRLLAASSREFPFLNSLGSSIDEFGKLSKKPSKHFLVDFEAESERLLDLKESLLDPIRRFMSGPQATLYADAKSFLSHNATNFDYLVGDEHTQLRALLADVQCYAGNGMKQVKSLLDSLRGRLETLATEARAAAEQAVTSKVQRLASIEGYDKLTDAQKQQIESIVYETIEQIKSQPLIAVVKEAASRFVQKGYTDILGKVNSWTQKPEERESSESETKPKPAWKPPVEFIGISHLSVSFERPWLESEPDITAYLTLLRQAMLDAIDAGKRIQV